MTLEALALFLALLTPEIVATEGDRITVRAEVGDVVWQPVGAQWCTEDGARKILVANSTAL